jgi:LysR family transcriptional regulator, transcriptional activator of nhaA
VKFLNYHHLRYFWVIAREGSLVAAGKVLHVSHPTLSAQVHALEEQVGQKLFVKSGRRMVLTDVGKIAYRYADDIFTIGQDLTDAMAGHSNGHSRRLAIGVVDAMPKLVVQKLLQPVLHLEVPVRLVCHEDRFDRLLSELALGTIDVVLSDSPIPTGSSVRAFHHLLEETDVKIFATPDLAHKYKRNFPASLDGAPFLLPSDQSALRRDLNQWFAKHKISPHIIAEFEDSALLKSFAAQGLGLFAGPAVVEDEVCAHYGVTTVGPATKVRERFYLVSSERKVTNVAVLAISAAAKM